VVEQGAPRDSPIRIQPQGVLSLVFLQSKSKIRNYFLSLKFSTSGYNLSNAIFQFLIGNALLVMYDFWRTLGAMLIQHDL
jgi:hypothetical protein